MKSPRTTSLIDAQSTEALAMRAPSRAVVLIHPYCQQYDDTPLPG